MLLCLYSTLIPEGHSAAGAGAQCGSEHRLWCSQHQSELQIPPGLLPSQSPAVAALVPFKCLPWFKQVHYNCWGFPGGSDSKESACSAGDPGSVTSQEDPLKKEMATYSSILAWRIPWTEEPGRL